MNIKYKRMLAGMARKEKAVSRHKLKKIWSVYILRCCDGSLYTGVTKDVQRRLGMHNAGRAAKYTRTRNPVKLVYHENSMTRSQALIRECAIKAWTKIAKEKFVYQNKLRKPGIH